MNKSVLITAALVMPAFFSSAQSGRAEDTMSKNMMMKPAATASDKAFAASMSGAARPID
jgi:hypothetical protein